ncbi:2Fe-2S iron-sulfur cluster-binding protein [Microbacter margulisiae]|uniref:NADH-quinone oxidoreductase subunit G n=1 Tax=Microbacter margulisiae TaxID=1350067 RepID=A0A7W5H091_9PORP|nr:2Fe-2S iron-sulfur cluster-binding protein [Microbacter margulisiae]MBB3186303.1 NADH-quinone oxidoreductase subunit G [Microbacter margulisiae]
MLTVTIDNHTIEVEEGTTILQAARLIGGDIVPPAMCYHSKLKDSGGKCRTCMVKVVQGSTKDPRPMPKLVPSCRTAVMDGMVVQNITSPEVLEARRAVVEFLLINHPLDCPVCDQAGECDLQNLSYEHGSNTSRFEEEKRTYDPITIGDLIQFHPNRCILCYRCVYAAEQFTNKRMHGVLYRGDKAEISTFIQQAIDNDFSGNMIDVCPVGALTDKPFRFKNRVWFLKPMDAHRSCTKCSGKATLWMRGNEVYRVTGRRNKYGEVEDFICNECRYEKKDATAWEIEGPRAIEPTSVISQNHYRNMVKPSVINPLKEKME